MMLTAPRIIAIDDERSHLEGLTKSLNQYGVACLQIHFTGDTERVKPCPHVRVIFADLHLGAGLPASDYKKDFSMIGSLIQETVKPSGPYFIVLWTRYPEQASNLQRYLRERLKGVTKPFGVLSLDKADHLDQADNVKCTKKLVDAIMDIARKQPQIAALLNWEERVLGAAAETVSSVVADRPQEVGRLLARLAVEGVGKEHVDRDRLRAVNEALLPILADRISTLRARNDGKEVWEHVFSQSDIQGALSQEEAANLNRIFHIALDADTGAERGAVISLPDCYSGDQFTKVFSLCQHSAAVKQFFYKKSIADSAQFRWVLVQAQAACDYAQNQPGPLPFYLGLDLEESNKRRDKPPAALWTSPPFKLDNKVRVLRVSARFQVSLPFEIAEGIQPLYRLRDQLLADLIHHVHTYGARPGMISFRKVKGQPA